MAEGRAPRDWLVDGQWPGGTLDPMAPPVAIVMQHIARRLQAVAGDVDPRQLAAVAGVDLDAVLTIVEGTGTPDFPTVVELEEHLHTDLWPQRRQHHEP